MSLEKVKVQETDDDSDLDDEVENEELSEEDEEEVILDYSEFLAGIQKAYALIQSIFEMVAKEYPEWFFGTDEEDDGAEDGNSRSGTWGCKTLTFRDMDDDTVDSSGSDIDLDDPDVSDEFEAPVFEAEVVRPHSAPMYMSPGKTEDPGAPKGRFGSMNNCFYEAEGLFPGLNREMTDYNQGMLSLDLAGTVGELGALLEELNLSESGEVLPAVDLTVAPNRSALMKKKAVAKSVRQFETQ